MTKEMHSIKEGELMRKMKDESFITDAILVAEYESVYHFALSLTRNETEAEDLTQETFLRAMKSSNDFLGESSIYTWLCAIAKNVWLTSKKKQNRIAGSPSDDSPSTDTPVEDLISDRDLSMCIHRILHELSEPYKEVFSLRVFGQLLFSDIAKLFGKTESWARVTYHRARKAILERLSADGMI